MYACPSLSFEFSVGTTFRYAVLYFIQNCRYQICFSSKSMIFIFIFVCIYPGSCMKYLLHFNPNCIGGKGGGGIFSHTTQKFVKSACVFTTITLHYIKKTLFNTTLVMTHQNYISIFLDHLQTTL